MKQRVEIEGGRGKKTKKKKRFVGRIGNSILDMLTLMQLWIHRWIVIRAIYTVKRLRQNSRVWLKSKL